MLLCYVDESGNEQLLDPAHPDAAPVLVIAGVIVDEVRLRGLIWTFLRIKKKFQRGLSNECKLSELITSEIKGSDLRADIRSGSHRRARRALSILNEVLEALERFEVRLTGCVWVKPDGAGLPANAYPGSVALLAENLQQVLAATAKQGLIVMDARTKWKNVPSVHGITTRKLRTGGDLLPDLVEAPVFGHSDAHIVLQVADLVASALLFPLACLAYCADLRGNVHPHPAYAVVQERFGARIRRLECRTRDADGRGRGGFIVRDLRNRRGARLLFAEPVSPHAQSMVGVPSSASTISRHLPAPRTPRDGRPGEVDEAGQR